MDGLRVYADIFASWVEGLKVFWGFLNYNVLSMIDFQIDNLSGNLEAGPAVGMLYFIKLLFNVFGFGELTVLGFLFSCMGVGFGIYFFIQMIKWLLDILP